MNRTSSPWADPAQVPDYTGTPAAAALKAARTRTPLTVADIERGLEDDRWLGFGYLGERAGWLRTEDPEVPARPERVAQADAFILERANELGWTYEQLFTWLNGRDGRHFADGYIGHSTPAPWAAGLGPRRGR